MPTATVERAERLAQQIIKAQPALYYALAHHRTHRGKRLDFAKAPALKALYADTRRKGCVMKSTQGGVSEWLLVNGISQAATGRNVFWVLPTLALVSRFVRERFDRTMQASPFYRSLVSDAGGSFSDSITLKQFGQGTIALVGSNAASSFTEFPADTLIVDELDQCDQGNVSMAWERLSAADEPREWYVSNPTVTGYGIDDKFRDSTQAFWHVRCSHCGAWVHPQYLGNVLRQIGPDKWLVIDPDFDMDGGPDARVYCHKCYSEIDARGQGQWVEKYPGRQSAGYHFNKLFTANVEVREIIYRWAKAEGDEGLKQRTWNADFGLAYDSAGARVDRADLLACEGEYLAGQFRDGGVSVVGVDVGARFHVMVGQVGRGAEPLRVVEVHEVRGDDDVREIVRRVNPAALVIDALPETRISRQLAGGTKNGYVCYFGGGKTETITRGAVTVDRTSLLDAVKAATVTRAVQYPKGMSTNGDFVDHMTASTRVYSETGNRGEGSYSWVEGSRADHWFLAHAYMLLAARLIVAAGSR